MSPINTVEEFYKFLDLCIDINPGVYLDCNNIPLKTICFDDCFVEPFLNKIEILAINYTKKLSENAIYINLYAKKVGSAYCDCIYYKDTKLISRGNHLYIFDNIEPVINRIKFERCRLVFDIFSELTDIEQNYQNLIKTIINNEYYYDK